MTNISNRLGTRTRDFSGCTGTRRNNVSTQSEWHKKLEENEETPLKMWRHTFCQCQLDSEPTHIAREKWNPRIQLLCSWKQKVSTLSKGTCEEILHWQLIWILAWLLRCLDRAIYEIPLWDQGFGSTEYALLLIQKFAERSHIPLHGTHAKTDSSGLFPRPFILALKILLGLVEM